MLYILKILIKHTILYLLYLIWNQLYAAQYMSVFYIKNSFTSELFTDLEKIQQYQNILKRRRNL